MIFVSTGGYKNEYPSKIVKELFNGGIRNIELSGGLFEEDLLKKLLKLKKEINFQLHNYFPPPKNSFVLNLASIDEEISLKSINLIKTAIEWSSQLESKMYGFHAGFLIDPNPIELGQKIKNRHINDRKVGMSLFIERVSHLAEYAKSNGVELLIENNVLSKNNHEEFKTNPLLMVDTNECLEIMKHTPKNVNLLLDTAHLKVSSNSLGFNPYETLLECSKWIKAYHFSDNNGLADSNEAIKKSSWFVNSFSTLLDSYTLEVYDISINEIKKQIKLLESLIN